MKTKFYSILILAMVLMYSAVAAQDPRPISVQRHIPKCEATVSREHMEEYRKNVQAEKSFSAPRGGGSLHMPVQFHLVRRSNGTGGISAEQAAWELDRANEKYVSAGIEFFQCSPAQFIDDDDYFNTEFVYGLDHFCGQTNDEYMITGQYNVSNVINIYYVNTDGWNWGSFPSGLDDCHDWLIMSIEDTGTAYLLAHELGHYFNLIHTFQGYGDGEGGNEENITRNSNADCYNCGEAGDLLCDTPADPNHWNSSCDWDQIGVDACSNSSFDPDPLNIMSYANGCQEYFTAGQIARIMYAASVLRSYLSCPYLSDCHSSWTISGTQNSMFAYQASDFITSTATISSGVTSTYDAANYVQLNPGFYAPTGSDFHIVNEGCWENVIFKEEETIHEVPQETVTNKNFILYPNPASNITTLSFSISKDSEIKIILEDVNGRLQKIILNENLNEGSHTLQLDLNQLSKGVYFVRMIAEDFVETKKLVVE